MKKFIFLPALLALVTLSGCGTTGELAKGNRKAEFLGSITEAARNAVIVGPHLARTEQQARQVGDDSLAETMGSLKAAMEAAAKAVEDSAIKIGGVK